MDLRLSILILVVVAEYYEVAAVSFDDVKSDISNVYDQTFDLETVRPVADSADTLNVTIDWNMVSINDFDEANGYLEVSGFLTLDWIPTGYPLGVQNVVELLNSNKIWRPPILLVNSLKDYDLIGYDTNAQVSFNPSTRKSRWQPFVISRIACSPNVKYFPFDKESCTFRFAVWGYSVSEVSLTPKNSDWGFQFYEENGEWTIERTLTETNVDGSISTVDFKIDLKRRSMYYVINLIAPVLLLGLVNAFTFVLPVDSGERVGFTITCFLSYVVLLNTIMGFLPTSAAPLSYLSYYTFIMMLFSGGVALTTILTIRIHFKPKYDHIPGFIEVLYKLFTCKYCKMSSPTTNRVQSLKTVTTMSATWDEDSDDPIYTVKGHNNNNNKTLQEDSVSQSTCDSEADKVTWKKIAAFFDFLFFLGFLGGQIFFSVAYLVPIFVN